MKKTSTLSVDDFVLTDTPVKEIVPKLERLRKGFASHKTKDLKFRLGQLKKLRASMDKYMKEIHRSNYLDLGFSEFISEFNSVSLVTSDVDHIIDNFQNWAKPEKVHTPILIAPGSSYIIPEPFGVCLIFSAWNSQYQTLIQPLAAAIASGNCILAKPSEMAPFSAKLMEYIFEDLDPDMIQIVQGGADQCIELTKNKSDIIVFTGSPMKGKLVAKAAAEHLTPCILELGGQNPVVVDECADIACTATNLINGRFLITGQACIAPEYAFVHKKVFTKLVEALRQTVEDFYTKTPKNSKDYSRIINEWHTDRLQNLLKTHGGKVIVGGGECNIKEKYVPPTVVEFSSIDDMSKSSLAKEEIFGPIFYFCPYEDINDAIKYINARDKPLSLYYFGKNNSNKDQIRYQTSSGAFVTNDCAVHFANHYLPFGGVGTSGYSAYHGKTGFVNLSHMKPVIERGSMIVSLRYPPFTSFKENMMRKVLGFGHITQYGLIKAFIWIGVIFALFFFRTKVLNGLEGFYNGIRK